MQGMIVEHDTPLGPMWSLWSCDGLYSLDWNPPSSVERIEPSTGLRRSADQLGRQIDKFFGNGSETFQDVPIDSSGWPEFTKRVYQRCRSIPPATTLTYKQLAGLAGNEKASRAVGAAMSRNRILLVIPCHRVISGGGQLRGFSAPGGLATKRRLLDLERQGRWPADRLADARTLVQG
jgi:methylated-DNA-[protein]-cysteine S-methyltransferase